MRFRLKLAVGVAVMGAAAVGTAAIAHDRNNRLEAFLHGYEEVPAVSTGRTRGSFKANISRDSVADRLDADVRWHIQGTVAQAHVHLGQLHRQRRHLGVVLREQPADHERSGRHPQVCPQPAGPASA